MKTKQISLFLVHLQSVTLQERAPRVIISQYTYVYYETSFQRETERESRIDVWVVTTVDE